jgi:hypothetical protein
LTRIPIELSLQATTVLAARQDMDHRAVER